MKPSTRGEYWLLDAAGERIFKWKRSYVPARFFDVTFESIVSDYIVLKIDRDGMVIGWNPPQIDPKHWIAV
jgi:hypothetical protein